MSGPPKDLPASQLWLKLASAERPFKLVDFPRVTPDGQPLGQIAIRILTQEEQMVCSAAAEELARKHVKDGRKDELGYERLFTDAVCVEVLFRACRDAENPRNPAFPTPKSLREALTTDECGALFSHYLTVQLELGPTVIHMTEGEIEAWISRLVEGGSSFPFDLLSSDLQKILLLHMAYQLRTSPTDRSSAGSQLDESEPRPSDDESPPPADE